jgi:hypothetical protein
METSLRLGVRALRPKEVASSVIKLTAESPGRNGTFKAASMALALLDNQSEEYKSVLEKVDTTDSVIDTLDLGGLISILSVQARSGQVNPSVLNSALDKVNDVQGSSEAFLLLLILARTPKIPELDSLTAKLLQVYRS